MLLRKGTDESSDAFWLDKDNAQRKTVRSFDKDGSRLPGLFKLDPLVSLTTVLQLVLSR